MKFYLNQYFLQTSSHEIVRRNVKLPRENLNLGSKIKHLSPVYRKRHRKAAQTTAKLVSSESKNEPNTTSPCPQISFSGHPRHGAVGQNIFLMYISIKRHSCFFKSWWCLLYFGRVQTRTTGKCWLQKTPFCLKFVGTCAMTPKAAILFKNVHTCARESLILKYEGRSIIPCNHLYSLHMGAFIQGGSFYIKYKPMSFMPCNMRLYT